MNFDALSDRDIRELITMVKRATNPSARWQENRGSRQKNFNVEGESYAFQLYLRQNTFDADHFSCGLSVIKPDGQRLTLLRYNGSNHAHGNIRFQCHIHRASERAIEEGRKPEWYADTTDTYHTLDGALYLLCNAANISGIANLAADGPDFFN